MRRVPFLLLILLAPWLRAADSIEAGEIKKLTMLGPVSGWWAKVRLDAPDLEPVVTRPLSRAERKNPEGAEAHLLPVDEWAKQVGATLAVNANFFSKSLIPAKEGDPKGYQRGQPVDLTGLSMSEGKIVSAPRTSGGQGDPALVIEGGGHARVGYFRREDLANARWAVAGVGAAEKQPGTLLVTDGKNTGETSRVQPGNKNPRTAAGVTADGRTLILVVVDGRQPTHSVGLTLLELADLMIELGAHNAVNLDGGGSSSFYFVRGDGSVVTNKPSDGQWRPVGNHLGFVRRQPGRN
jgi:exopolysaccharide biosynthesis protein